MAKLHGLQADYIFRGVEHVVRLAVEGNLLLEVEVEDRLPTDQWRGEFDAASRIQQGQAGFCSGSFLAHTDRRAKTSGKASAFRSGSARKTWPWELRGSETPWSRSLAVVEDLTHKTGNFKQFGIFCSMLESALAQSSESVTLDRLTYTDLELLRSRKIGVGPRHTSATAAKISPLSTKRYLILIYSVEFDSHWNLWDSLQVQPVSV